MLRAFATVPPARVFLLLPARRYTYSSTFVRRSRDKTKTQQLHIDAQRPIPADFKIQRLFPTEIVPQPVELAVFTEEDLRLLSSIGTTRIYNMIEENGNSTYQTVHFDDKLWNSLKLKLKHKVKARVDQLEDAPKKKALQA